MPWSNEVPSPQLLSLCSRAREPQLLSPRAWSPGSATREATTMRSLHSTTTESPCSPQLEETWAQQRRLSAAKSK